jgi:hypothetical protein
MLRLRRFHRTRRAVAVMTGTQRGFLMAPCSLVLVVATRRPDCVRTVSLPPETPAKHRELRGDADEHRCCRKSLIGSALVGFGVRQHARRESISKRAPSMKVAVHRTGAFRRPDREPDPAVSGVFNTRVARELDAGSSEQSGLRQSLAGNAVTEKNRWIRTNVPGAWTGAFRRQFSRLAGTISGTIEGTVGGCVSRDLVYT